MKQIAFIIGILTFAYTSLFSQDLKQVIRDNSDNFKDIHRSVMQDPSILENESPRFQKEFSKWSRYWRTRVDSSGSMKPFMKEMTRYATKSTRNTATYKVASTSNNYWTCEGPNIRPGRPGGDIKTIGQGLVSSIWVNPDDQDTILIGASNAGLWRTTNGGTNWTCLTEGTMTGGVKDIIVDPSNKNIIYIVTQIRINNSCQFRSIGQYSLGIFKTTDGGSNWTRLNTSSIPEEEYFMRILIHHPTPTTTTLYALTIKEVYKSTNAGSTWVSTDIGYPAEDTYGLQDMEFHPNDYETLYVSGSNALYKTEDGGDIWTSKIDELTNITTDAVIALAVDENNSSHLYALYVQNNIETLDKSTNEGDNFSNVSTPSLYAKDFLTKIWVAPDGDIFAGGVTIHRSRNGGSTFTSALSSNLIHDDKRDCFFPDPSNGNLIYLATDGGVYMDTNDGDSWENITGDLPINEFVSLDITTEDPNIMFGGTMDCGSYLRNQDGSWTFLHGCDGGTSLLNQNDYNTYYYTCNGSFHRVDATGNHTIDSDLAFFDSPIIMDPSDSDILYRTKWLSVPSGPPVALQRSLDKGDNWSTRMMLWNRMTDMSICDSNPDTYYFTNWSTWTTQSRIFKSSDGGINHSEVSYSGMTDIILEAPITNIVVNPFDENIVWVTFGGSGTSGKKVFYSSDGGGNWSDKTGTGLPDLPVQCFVYDYLNNDIYIGTDVGVYYKPISDVAWQEEEDFPKVLVSDLFLNKSSGDIVAGTYGRGVWRKNVGVGDCVDLTEVTISTSMEWNGNSVCANVVIASGGTLTIKGTTIMSYRGMITVESNGVLEIDGGEVENGKIIVEDGGELEISNGGMVHLNYADHLEIETGGILHIISGGTSINTTIF